MSAMSARVSVVIATKDRPDELAHVLSRLARLPEALPVVVVDDASEDRRVQAVVRASGCTYLRTEVNLGCGARNLGVRLARTPYVAFCDDDSWWAPGALDRAADHLDQHPGVALLNARILLGPDERLEPTCALMAASPLPTGASSPDPALLGFIACGAVVRRAAFLAVGGFESRFHIGGEEEPLALALAAAGWELAYLDDVVAHHHPSPNRDPARRRVTIARNELWSAWLYRDWRHASARTWELAVAARRESHARRALLEAMRGAAWVARHRRPVSPALEEQLELLGR